jgi:hypothetical protein
MSAELKACPWCGSGAARHFAVPDEHNQLSYGVQCSSSACGITGPERGNPEDAAAAWNRRTPLPVQAGEANAGREGGLLGASKTAQTRMDTGLGGGHLPGANMAGAGGQGGEDGNA